MLVIHSQEEFDKAIQSEYEVLLLLLFAQSLRLIPMHRYTSMLLLH